MFLFLPFPIPHLGQVAYIKWYFYEAKISYVDIIYSFVDIQHSYIASENLLIRFGNEICHAFNALK